MAGVTGGVLLLVYWTLKLPAVEHKFTSLAHQYPAQCNILLRLLEPLATPEEMDPTREKPRETAEGKARFDIRATFGDRPRLSSSRRDLCLRERAGLSAGVPPCLVSRAVPPWR